MLLPETKNALSMESAVETADPQPGWGASWSFRLTMLRYHRLVYRVSLQLLQDSAEAEDVCQESFLRYWRHQMEVRQAKEWLLRVARNLCLSRLRRRGRLLYSDRDLEFDVALCDPDQIEPVLPEEMLNQEQRAQDLRQAVNRLPEPQRSLVLLYDFEGLDGASCGRILELSSSQVKVYLHRARKRLRRQLEHCL